MAKVKILLSIVFIFLVVYDVSGQCDCVVERARSYIGVREATGNNDGEEVGYFLSTTGLGEGYAWCVAFLNAIHEECGQPTPEKGAWSPAWFPSSRTIYIRGKAEGISPQPGDVGGIYFRSKGRIAHGFLVEEWGNKIVTTIEGNTNEAGSREGDGVYRKRRLKKQVYKVSRWRD